MDLPKGVVPLTSTIKDARSSYERSLKDDLGQLINALELGELHKHSLRSRWLDQVLWMEKKASHCQRRYYIFRLTAIVGGVIVPALVGLNLANNQFAAGLIQWTAFGLGIIVAISVASEEFFHFGERWRHYRSTAERLKIEGWQFFQLGGPYQDFKDHKEAYSSFATRTESIHQQEVDVYITEIAKEKKKDRAENPNAEK
jgi:Protein of unknown function (DUF4231)